MRAENPRDAPPPLPPHARRVSRADGCMPRPWRSGEADQGDGGDGRAAAVGGREDQGAQGGAAGEAREEEGEEGAQVARGQVARRRKLDQRGPARTPQIPRAARRQTAPRRAARRTCPARLSRAARRQVLGGADARFAGRMEESVDDKLAKATVGLVTYEELKAQKEALEHVLRPPPALGWIQNWAAIASRYRNRVGRRSVPSPS